MPIKKLKLAAGATIIVLCCQIGEASHLPKLTLDSELPPIRATYLDVSSFSNDIQSLVARSAASHSEKKEAQGKYDYTYQIAAKNISLAGISLDALLKDPRLPNPAYEFKINRIAPEESISYIEISFGLTKSKYKIEGTDIVALESLRGRIESFGREHSTWLGGDIITLTVYLLFLGTGFALVFAPDYKATPKSFSIIIVGFCLIVLGSYLLLSSKLSFWFPMTAIFLGSASFIERYSAEITFWGFIVTLLGTLVTIALAVKTKKAV